MKTKKLDKSYTQQNLDSFGFVWIHITFKMYRCIGKRKQLVFLIGIVSTMQMIGMVSWIHNTYFYNNDRALILRHIRAMERLRNVEQQKSMSRSIQREPENKTTKPWQLTVKGYNLEINVHTHFNMSNNSPIKWLPRIGLSAMSNIVEWKHLSIRAISKASGKPINVPHYNCSRLYNESLTATFVFPRVYGICDGYKTSAISLLIQMDREQTDYLVKLAEIASNWKGPISMTLYYAFVNGAINHSRDFFINDIEHLLKTYGILETTVCVHVVYVEQETNLYPINMLRNVAMQFAPTDTILLSEVDFMLPPNLDETIRKEVTLEMLTLKKLYIIPVFGTLHKNYTIAATKEDLVSQWNNNITVPMTVIKKDYPHGHSAVDYDLYQTATKMYQVRFLSTFEPYYIVNRSLVPYYPEEFFWGFRDKNIHARILGTMGWEFIILPDVFMVHTPHTSQVRQRNSDWTRCTTSLCDFLQNAVKTLITSS